MGTTGIGGGSSFSPGTRRFPENADRMTEMVEPESVFVYGSLMRGLELHRHIEFGTFVSQGTTKGVLLSLGRYPGLVDGDAIVRGEIYRFADLPAALDVLDDIEDFDATNPDGSMYVRVARPVMTDDGQEVISWLYVYNQPTQGAVPIQSGDWRNACTP
jgi:gamma-glutamylcyclotransferase (GGCT)/AIG2-like uncharacterized protein YtfP